MPNSSNSKPRLTWPKVRKFSESHDALCFSKHSWADCAASTRQNPPSCLTLSSGEAQISLGGSDAAPATYECLKIALQH
jgi:hypothetical protein